MPAILPAGRSLSSGNARGTSQLGIASAVSRLKPGLVRWEGNVHTEGESPSLVELPTSNRK